MAVNVKPLGDRVLVKPLPKEEVSRGGIILPDTAKEKPQEGEVVAVGPGRISDEGKRLAMEVKEGDRVIYARYAGTEVMIEREEYVLLRETDVLAKRS